MKKNFTLKSALALIVVCVMAPTYAQVSSVADLFGKYKFTATIEVTEAGKAYTDHFKNECEVVITKCSANIYDGEIQGLAGATGIQKINGIDTENQTLKITNPNGNGVWGGGLYMSDTHGMYPFGVDSTYNDILYTYDAATKSITLPDFSLVTCDHANQAATVVAQFTNTTLTLVEAETIEVADLSGEWHYTAGSGAYDTMEGSTLPKEWDMTLTATDDSKRNYSISLTLGDFAPLALTATFDGAKLVIPFENSYLDVENKISLWDPYGGGAKGSIEFNMVSENSLTLSMMYIRQDSISPEVKGGALQYYMNGLAKRQGNDEVITDSWDGTYKVKGTVAMVAIEDYTYPTEFEMEVKYFEEWGIYLVTKFFGNDISNLNNGGLLFTPSADDPNKAEFKTGLLQTIEAGVSYLCLKDMNLADSPLTLTRNADGTYTISDFSVSYMTYDASWNQNHAFAAFYQGVTAEKAAAEEPATFSWASTFTVKAGNISVYNDAYTYPTEFEMEVKYYEEWGIYLVTKFFGNDVTALNNGGIGFSVSADDPNKAEMTTSRYLQTIETGVSYLCLMDMNLSNSALTLTRHEDGTITISDFCISLMTYDASWNQNHAAAALYSGVTATQGATAIDEIVTPATITVAEGTIYVAGEAQLVEVYDMSGRNVSTGVTTQVNGLNNGLYIVRVAGKTTKVAIVK